ncbi:MAG: hypothetical protein IV090_17155 [Candidatus Sericytochromatia bacterium]|nr:hypothetical protein [Candidatus Sericytochromatia bacterium]
MSQAPSRSFNEVKALIVKNAAEHAPLTDEAMWLYESLEQDTLVAIFEYIQQSGVQIVGLNLRQILDAWYKDEDEEDEEDEQIHTGGTMETLWDLQNRMTFMDIENPIPVSDEIKDLFKLYNDSFWPED